MQAVKKVAGCVAGPGDRTDELWQTRKVKRVKSSALMRVTLPGKDSGQSFIYVQTEDTVSWLTFPTVSLESGGNIVTVARVVAKAMRGKQTACERGGGRRVR